MKLTNYLIFSINKKKYAIKASQVLKILPNAKLMMTKEGQFINYCGLRIEVITLNNSKSYFDNKTNACLFLLIENVFGEKQILALLCEQVLDLRQLDNFAAYSFMRKSSDKEFFQQTIIDKGEVIHIINPGALIKTTIGKIKNTVFYFN